MTDEAIAERLAAWGAALEFPRDETLADDVVAAIGERSAGRFVRKMLLAAAAVVALALAAVVAIPDSRDAVARWLGLARLEVRIVEQLPAAPAGELGPSFTLEGAAAAAGVTPYVAPALGEPVSVHAPGGRYVAVRYDDAGTDVLVATLPGKLFHKRVSGRSQVEPVEVNGVEAIWVTGDPHVLVYADAGGDVLESRLAADTLAWQDGEVIVRVEGDVGLERALELASDVRLAGEPEG